MLTTTATIEELGRQAQEIARGVAPDKDPESACMLVAAAIAGLQGLTLREVRAGILIHRTKFQDNPYMMLRGGWGVVAVDWSSGRVYPEEPELSSDGSFNGHCWVQGRSGDVLDPLHDYAGSPRELGSDGTIVGAYIAVPRLERLIKGRWGLLMSEALQEGRAMQSLVGQNKGSGLGSR